MSQPLFILGAPRSGTTFLCCALNQHPSIVLTNESRIFVLLKDLVETRSAQPHLLEPEHRERFQEFVRQSAGQWVEEFYRQSLGVTTPIWGDKHPSYGDPAVLTGRDGASVAEPRSGSCLQLILDCLPTAKFIHLHRHPWQVAASMRRRGWVISKTVGVEVWRQHVEEIDRFLDRLPAAQALSLRFADLVDHPDMVARKLGGFLGLGATSSIARFLEAQRVRPTPFSSPTTDLRQPHITITPSERGQAALRGVADLTWRLGYLDC